MENTNQDPVRQELVAKLAAVVNDNLWRVLTREPWERAVDPDWVEQQLVRPMIKELVEQICDSWVLWLEHTAKRLALECPGCGHPRKCKRRQAGQMTVRLLGFDQRVPKLYLECGRCGSPGISVTKLLTDLRSGSVSTQLELVAAFCASQHSYAKASQEIEVHHGQRFDRTTLRRLALRVEQEAKLYAEQQREQAVRRLEERTDGPPKLMLQADGGSVRTGKLRECVPGEDGFGKQTPTGRRRRKRDTCNRELITMDVREPGQADPLALDVVVPVVAPEGQRAERMLACAARAGLGDNTQMIGLGDLGSGLPQAFDEAFHGWNHVYSGDWKHVCDYIDEAAEILDDKVEHEWWRQQMKECVWNRAQTERDELLHTAHMHRDVRLLAPDERCPVYALESYVKNNWDRMRAKQLKEAGLDFVSARAEAQVRDRTKDRYAGPGAWHETNLEGKAILRSIIAEGRWSEFHRWVLDRRATDFAQQLRNRLHRAAAEGRIRQDTEHTDREPKAA